MSQVNEDYLYELTDIVNSLILEYETQIGHKPIVIQVHPATKKFIDKHAGCEINELFGVPIFADERVQPERLVLTDIC